MTGIAPIAPWLRADRRATGRIADAMFVVLHAGALSDDVPLSARLFGSPSAAALQVLAISAIDDAAWIDGWRRGGIRALAEADLGADLRALDGADRCHLVRATVADPLDHVHVQAAWAVARWLCTRGASVVLDVFALRWHAAAALLAAPVDDPFDLDREITVIAETTPARGARDRCVHSRGLRKLARPDVIALAADADIADAKTLVHLLAQRLADGWMPEPSGEVMLDAHPWGRVLLTPAPAAGGLPDALGLQNDALLVART